MRQDRKRSKKVKTKPRRKAERKTQNSIELSKKIKELVNSENFNENLTGLLSEYPDRKEEIANAVKMELDKKAKEIDNNIANITVRMQLSGLIEVLPLSYIAQTYFHKTRQWLYQRINGTKVNGKPAKFTNEEKIKLNEAIQDISKKIGSINIA